MNNEIVSSGLSLAPAKSDSSPTEWTHRIASGGLLKLGHGAVLCIELKDRSHDGAELTGARLQAIWARLERDFGGRIGLGFLDELRGLALASDESAWISIAAAAVEAAIEVGIEGYDIGVGVGFASMETREQSVSDVIRLSALAARDASETGFGLAKRSLAQDAREQRAQVLRKSLKEALDGGLEHETEALRVIFQPKVDAATRAIVGAEALVRFRCPELGDVSAVELLSVAEACGELQRIDRWVLGLAAECQSHFRERGIQPIPISVNVRAETAFAPRFQEFLGSLLTAFKVEPGQLEIELREGEIMKNLGLSERVVSRLRELGASVALDDFGTRRTTLADLRRLRVTTLKLDRSIVREMMSSDGVAQIAHGMLHLARVLKMKTVAVGIESEEQAETLAAAGCGMLQGYWFYQPLEFADFVARSQESDGRLRRSHSRCGQ